MYLCFNVSIYNFTWCITLNDVRGFENERCCHIAEREREFFSRRSKLKNFFFSSMYNIIVLQNNNWKIYIFSLLLRERKKSSYLILFKLDLKCSRWNRFQVDAVGNPGHKTIVVERCSKILFVCCRRVIDKRALVGFSMVAFFLFLRYGSICSAISVPAFGDDSLCVCYCK